MFETRRQITTALLTIAMTLTIGEVARAEPAAPDTEDESTPSPSSPAPSTAQAPSPSAVAAPSAQPPDEDRVPVTVGFLYPLATNANRPNVTSNADISPLYGRVGAIEGAQVGGVVVHASRDIDGVQLGGVAAISGGAVRGVQIGGVTNVALEGVHGVQLSPVNIGTGPIDGLQLGVVNVGKKVRGLQLGLINVAEDVDGASLGLVSISRNSVHPIAWTSNLQYMNAGVKFTTKYVFTMIGAHYGTHEADFDSAGVTLAIGGHIPLPASFDLEVQGSFTELAPSLTKSGEDKHNSFIAPQIAAGYSFAPHLRAFVGGGARLPITVNLGRDVSRPELLAGLQF